MNHHPVVNTIIIIIALGALALLGYPIIRDFQEQGLEKKYQQKIKNIQLQAQTWAEKHPEKLLMVDGKSYFLSVNFLKDNGFLQETELINPKTKQKIDGCIKIQYQDIYKKYDYTYINDNCDNLVTGIEAITQLDNIVETGDGLYITNQGNYVFKGKNPKNYMKIGSTIYRIIGIDVNGLKVIQNESIENHPWDSSDHRKNDNSYCLEPEKGCNAYSSNGNTVLQNSSIYDYLYQNLRPTLGTYLVENVIWNIGKVASDDITLTTIATKEKKETITADVSVPSLTDIMNASSLACSTIESCKKQNWLLEKEYFLINGNSDNSYQVYQIKNHELQIVDASLLGGIRPVFYIKGNLKIVGEGTSVNPYQFK